VGALRKCGLFYVFWHISGVRISHMGAAALVGAASCLKAPIGPAASACVDAAATGARGRWVPFEKADRWTLFCTLPLCASLTWVRRSQVRLQAVGELKLVLFHSRVRTPLPPGRAAGACNVQMRTFHTFWHIIGVRIANMGAAAAVAAARS